MNLLCISCKEETKNAGFKHSVYECLNGNVTLKYSSKFSDILSHPLHIKSFTADPEAFVTWLETSE